MKKMLPIIAIALIFLIGVGILSYPLVSSVINNIEDRRHAQDELIKIENMGEKKRDALFDEAEEYNRKLISTVLLTDPFDDATYEKIEEVILVVIKKDGSREPFDRNKLLNGIIKACEKRPVSLADMEKCVDDIERGLNNMMEKEVKSTFIGELIMEKLKDLDEVAYVRFASVYRQFTDVNTFISEIEKMLGTKRGGRNA